jgi:hypothetical protein
MPTNYLVYWRPKNVDYALARRMAVDYASSNQFQRIYPEDVCWFVTVRKGELFLISRLLVGERTTWEAARQILKRENLRKARYVVIAKQGTEEVLSEVPINDIAPCLRFTSKYMNHLTIRQGGINPQQLQTIRQLTDTSSKLLEDKWNCGKLLRHSTSELDAPEL